MKKIIKGTAIILTAAMFITCTEGGNNVCAAKSFKVAKKKVSVKCGKSVKVKYFGKGKIKLSVKNKKIAKASKKGRYIIIKGKKKGNTKVIVKCKSKKAVIKVSVENKDDLKIKPVTPTKTPEDVTNAAISLSPYASSVNSFGCDAFTRLKNNNDNTFISPLSIHMALSMLACGAEGETYNQLANVLGISDMNAWNSAMSTYVRGSLDKDVQLHIANSVWLGQKLNPSPDEIFAAPLRNNYNAEIFKDVPFDMGTVDKANAWASEKTNKMIPKIVNEFSDDIVAMLMNAIYFDAQWTKKFYEANTADEIFKGSKGNTTVKMMNMSRVSKKYFKNDYMKGLEMTYGSGKYAMDILLSADDNANTADVWNSLTKEQRENTIMEFAKKVPYSNIKTLKVPKFELEYSVDSALQAVLKNMGITDVFDERKANLSKIGTAKNGGNLFVSDIIHKTALKVDENGTKAAAVTAIKIAATSALREEPVYDIEFIVDRPFILMIRDTVSGMVLFMGEVNNL